MVQWPILIPMGSRLGSAARWLAFVLVMAVTLGLLAGWMIKRAPTLSLTASVTAPNARAINLAGSEGRGSQLGQMASPAPTPEPPPPPAPTPSPVIPTPPAPQQIDPSVDPAPRIQFKPEGPVCAAASKKPAIQKLAAALSDELIAAYAEPRGNWIGLEVVDNTTGLQCGIDADHKTEVASVDKALIVASLLYKYQREHTPMSDGDRTLAEAAITASDNNAATELWRHLGATGGASAFLQAAGIDGISLAPDGYWGRTKASASGEVELVQAITDPNGVLSKESQSYLLDLMQRVHGDQNWGISKGAADSAVISLKNGWGPFPVGGWHVNSIGNIATANHNYSVAIMSDNNGGTYDGIPSIERLADVINAALG